MKLLSLYDTLKAKILITSSKVKLLGKEYTCIVLFINAKGDDTITTEEIHIVSDYITELAENHISTQ